MSGRWTVRQAITDCLLALFIGAASAAEVRNTPVGLLPAAAGVPLAVIAAIALLFRRRHPIPVLTVTLLAMALVGALLPIVPAVFTVADRFGNRARTWIASAATLVVLLIPWGIGWSGSVSASVQHAVLMALFLAVPLLFGLWTNQRAQTLNGLRERAEQAERERDLRAAAAVEAERIRIARELHDIVAHRISQITVLAGALEVSAEGRPADIAGTIRDTGSRALDEMRELLGVLRTSDDRTPKSTDRQGESPPPAVVTRSRAATDEGARTADDGARDVGGESGGRAVPDAITRSTDPGWGGVAPLRPAPGLSAVSELVQEAVAAGQRVDLTLPPELPEVTGPVGRAVYRIVQEALTNAAKHAAGAEVRVEMTVHERELRLDVRNGRGDRSALARQGSGFGLLGMRERVELAGGTLYSGPLSAGGFAVHARFPLRGVEN